MTRVLLILAIVLGGCSNILGFSDPILRDGGADHHDGATDAQSTAKQLVAFGFTSPPVSGTVDEANQRITVTVPNGTTVTALVATFTTTGASVKVGSVLQQSGTTPNDFTTPVVYVVTAGDGSTATYTVTVTVASSSMKAITSFAFTSPSATGTIDEGAKTIAVTVPFGTTVTALIATFATTGVSVKVGGTAQVSGLTANDFSSPVAYLVTAGDGSTTTYTVTVAIASGSARQITSFAFTNPSATGTIDQLAKTIAVTVPFGTDVTALVATFTTTGVSVRVGPTPQISGTTPNDFTSPVDYVVTAANLVTATYTVTVTVAANTTKAITSYAFTSPSATGSINEAAKTIAVTVPFGTNVAALIATFTTTGTSVAVGSTVQTSGTTSNNFTSPVPYIVTAADTSTATYTVTVTVAPSSMKQLTTFGFANPNVQGTIDEANKAVAVTVPFGTTVTGLVATFTTTGANVKIGATLQTSGSNANDFTSPVQYTVTAADNSMATYTVTVAIAPNSTKQLTSFSFTNPSATGTINEAAKTVAVTVPFGTTVTSLVATFTTTGASVKVGSTVQTSGTSANDFTSPVPYIVTAGDTSTATYTVTVTVSPNSAKQLTSFAFTSPSAIGTINEAGKTVAVTVPFGTNLTALVATFTTTGASVRIGPTPQISGTTPNDFTSPVMYVVTAADSFTATYTVTVTVAPSSMKQLTSFSFTNPSATGAIDEMAKTVAVTVPFGTSVTSLVANFTTTGVSVKIGSTVQTSGSNANDFTGPVQYIVTAADSSTATYTVTVTVSANAAKQITSFAFTNPSATGTINEGAKTIAVQVPSGTNVTALIASFTTTGMTVKVGPTVQTSGVTPNDFTNPVPYVVIAADSSMVTYTVTVAIAPNSMKQLTSFGFASPAVLGTINEPAKTIAVSVPFGTSVTALVASFTTTGASVKVGATVQTSGVTANDFTSPVPYLVTAADTTSVTYTVTVTILPCTFISATGGTVMVDAMDPNFKIHTFTAGNGTFTITCGSGQIESLVVAGGGGGGSGGATAPGGGGGAGQLIHTMPGATYNMGAYTVTVGAGGTRGLVGHPSVFDTITAAGGGRGGDAGAFAGGAGGSGGGGGGSATTPGLGGMGTPPCPGGCGGGRAFTEGGGGGGCGGAGAAAVNGSHGGDGGAGCSVSIMTGTLTFMASGGGGGTSVGGETGGMALPGGGVGGGSAGFPPAAGINTGGGGGGGGMQNLSGGGGGSGIVILRYQYK